MSHFGLPLKTHQTGAVDCRFLLRRFLFSLLLVLAMELALLAPALQAVQADAGANDLIDAVNALRASYGLVPYQVDPQLMKFAQDHADYMMSIQTITHLLADGTSADAHGLTENIVGGVGLGAEDIVNTKWNDELHMHTLLGYSQGYIGAGVAQVDGFSYYALVVRNTGRLTGLKPIGQADRSATPAPTETPGATENSCQHPANPGAGDHRV